VVFGFSFLGATAAKRFCIASGAFYLTLATLGLTIGNPAYLGPMLLHTGDHIFHLVLGSIFLAMGLVSGRQ
jgi:heme/copper-type cytochrome/quinol oxidase subunit 3